MWFPKDILGYFSDRSFCLEKKYSAVELLRHEKGVKHVISSCTSHLSKSFFMKPIVECYWVRPEKCCQFSKTYQFWSIPRNVYIWVGWKVAYLFEETCRIYQVYYSPMVNTLFKPRSVGVVYIWKVVETLTLSTISSYGNHQICISSCAEIIKPWV